MEVPGIQGFELVGIVVGMVQYIKERLNLQSGQTELLTLGIGLPLFGYWSAVQAGVIPEVVILYVNICIRALGYTLAVPGLYKVAKHELLPAIAARVRR